MSIERENKIKFNELLNYFESELKDTNDYKNNLLILDTFIKSLLDNKIKINDKISFQIITYSKIVYSSIESIITNLDIDEMNVCDETKNLLSSVYRLEEEDNEEEKSNDDIYAGFDNSYKDLDLVGIYLKEIGNKPRLEPEEERKLFDIYRETKDSKIKNKIVESNLRLVVKYAKKYVGNDISFLDLIQDGSLGLMRAVELYDPEKGFKFSTYATYWIKQTIIRAIYDKGRNIRIPVHMHEEISKYKKDIAKLEIKLGHKLSKKDILENLDITLEKYNLINQYINDTVSFNQKIGDEEDTELIEFIPDNDANPETLALNSVNRDYIEKIFEGLSEREVEVIKHRFGFYNGRVFTLEEVGNKYGITRERARQIEAKALRKMKNAITLEQKKIENKRLLREINFKDEISKMNQAKYNIYYKFTKMGYDEDTISEAIGKLSKVDQAKLYGTFGYDLQHPVINNKYQFSQSKLNYIANTIIDKRLYFIIDQLFKSKHKDKKPEEYNPFDKIMHVNPFTNDLPSFINSKSLFDFFKKLGYSREQVTLAIGETYTPENMYILNFCYTNGFDKPLSSYLTQSEIKELYENIVNNILYKYLTENCIKNQTDKILKLNFKDQSSKENMG